MNSRAEDIYRGRLADVSPILEPTLNSLVPSDAAGDDAMTRLTRELCFESLDYGGVTTPSLSEALPHVMDHGLRQVALANTVLADQAIRDKLPTWFDIKLFGCALLVADAGLVRVSRDEVTRVTKHGPKYMECYGLHPQYGYEMAQQLRDPQDGASQRLALLIARHHAVQARNSYGLPWSKLDSRGIDPAKIDLMISTQKPFDYFDDSFSRRIPGVKSFTAQARMPIQKFSATFNELLDANPALTAHMAETDFDPQLPNLISAKILDVVLDGNNDGIAATYRALRPDLTLRESNKSAA